jgi:SulP family sulfate permease
MRVFDLAYALPAVVREGLDRAALKRDILAGLVVGIVALPLSMALAIASGVPPQHGLYTAIIAGAVIGACGGSRVQVSGPTAAFVVILVPVAAQFGLGGLCIATVMAGVMLFFLGALGMGTLLQFVPHPVTTGFTAGIGVVIATLQLKDFFGLTVAHMPDTYVDRVETLLLAAPSARWQDFVIGLATLALLVVWPRITSKVPGALVAITVTALGAAIAHHFAPGAFDVATIGSRFSYAASDGSIVHGIPRAPPLPVLPWHLPGPAGVGEVGLSFSLIRQLLPSAFAIAMLGAIESLLSATVADGMSGTKHDANAELVGQGLGNIIAPFFAGFAATGAIARTATNVRSGGRSPIASITHAVFVLVAVVALAPLLAYLPMAALAALLLFVAYNMSDVKMFTRTVRTAPRSDVVVLLVCFSLTVLFDMVISVTAGVMLAALLFMRRMAEMAGARFVEGEHPALRGPLPDGVLVYELAGPLFFGAAQKAMNALHYAAEKKRGARTVILDFANVPVMDATGLVALTEAIHALHEQKITVVLAAVKAQPREVLKDAELEGFTFAESVASALDVQRTILAAHEGRDGT